VNQPRFNWFIHHYLNITDDRINHTI
jgi:hypothetical protein